MATAGAIRAGRAYVELFADDSKLVKGLRTAEYKVRAFGKELSGIGQGFMKLGAVIAAPLALGVREFSTYGDRIAKMSKATGIGAQSLSELAFAAERSGTDLDSLQTGLRRMSKSVYELQGGGKEAAETFAAIGLSVSDLQGLKPEEQFKRIADGLSRVEDETARAALAQKIFGRGGGALIPLLAQGAAGIEALQQKARDLGIVMSDQDARAAELLHDALTDLQFSVKAAARAIGAALAPSVRDVATAIPKVVKGFVDWTKAHQGLIIGLAKVAALLIGTGGLLMLLGSLAGAVANLIRILPMLAKMIHAVGVAMTFLAAHPVVAVLLAVAAAATFVAIKMRHAGEYTAKLTHEAQALREETDRQVQADSDRWAELKRLAEASSLSYDQMKYAREIMGQLEAEHGNLGFAIDETTGKIIGMTEAQINLNKSMREGQVVAMDAEIAKMDADLAPLHKKAEAIRSRLPGGTPISNRPVTWIGLGPLELAEQQEALEKLNAEILTKTKERAGAYAKREMIRMGTAGGIKTPTVPGVSAAEIEKSWVDKVHELRIAAIEDERTRAIYAINWRYQQEWDNAKALVANKETLATIEQARRLEIQTVNAEADRKIVEDQKTFIDDLAKKTRDIKIEMIPDEQARKVAQFKVEYDELLAKARQFGKDAVKGVQAWGEVRAQQIAAGMKQVLAATTAAGTFNPLAAWGMAIGPGTSAAERTAKATEETAKGVKRIVQLQFD